MLLPSLSSQILQATKNNSKKAFLFVIFTPWCIYWDGECIKQERQRPSPIVLEQLLYNKAAEDSALVKAADAFAKARDKLNPFAKKD